jgi:hypothetical protein
MHPQHRSHLLSTQSTIREHLAAIRKVATTGVSPGGGRSAPLPVATRAQLLEVLDRLEASLSEIVQVLALERTPRGDECQDAGGARMWTAVLLRTVAELVGDLDPEVMQRRYGSTSPAAARALREAVPHLLAEVERGVALLSGG